jgi:hypothetical protein
VPAFTKHSVLKLLMPPPSLGDPTHPVSGKIIIGDGGAGTDMPGQSEIVGLRNQVYPGQVTIISASSESPQQASTSALIRSTKGML